MNIGDWKLSILHFRENPLPNGSRPRTMRGSRNAASKNVNKKKPLDMALRAKDVQSATFSEAKAGFR